MKPRPHLFFGSLLVFCAVHTAMGAPIYWETPVIIGADTQILTSGTGVYAYTQSNSATTVNGVNFTSVNSSANWGSGNVTLAFPAAAGINQTTFGTPTGVSAAYGNLTKGAAYGGAGTGTITLNNLTVGRTYLAQIWVNDSRTTGGGRNQTVASTIGNSVVLDYNDTNALNGAGQFTSGRFPADAATQAFTLTSASSAQLNSLQLRDISNIGAWVGTGGATWDASTTSNFASNLFNTPLNTTTFDAAKAALNSVAFGDVYWDGGTASPVTQTAVTVAEGGVSTGRIYFDNHTLNYTLSCADTTGITGSTAVFKTGTGNVIFTGTNTYTGGTVITGGNLSLAAAATGGTYTIHPGGTLAFSAGSSFSQTAATTINGNGTLKLESNLVFGTAQTIATAMGSAGLIWVTNNSVVTGSSTNRGNWSANQASLQVDAGSEINFVEAANTTIRVNALNGAGTVRGGYNGTRTLELGVAGGTGSFPGNLKDRIDSSVHILAITKAGAGTQTLSGTANTYTGVTTMAGGILNVANLTDYGVAGSLGARTTAQEVATNIGLRFLGGTLQYTGSTPQSTNRQIRIHTSGGTIDASGSTPEATVSFTHNGTNTDLFDSPGTRTLTLTGTNPGANTLAIGLQNQASSATSLTKTGPGTWVLTGDSSYTGTTNVSDGVLRIASVNALGGTGGATSVPGGATPTSRVELSGELVFPAEPLSLGGRQGSAIDAPHLSNFSGKNEWTGAIATQTGGQTYNIESQADLLTVSGSISLSQAGTRTLQLMGAGNGLVSGVISGAVGNDARLTKKGAGTWTLSGANTYNGITTIEGGTLTLASTGQLRFVPTTNGTTNAVLGTGTFNANGKFLLDLSGTNDTAGNSWLLVNVGTLNEFFGDNFTVTSTAGDLAETSPGSGVWEITVSGKKWTFTESTGTLGVADAATDDYTTWANSFTPTAGLPGADDDGDGLTNFVEYAFGLNPKSASSVNPVTAQLNKGNGKFSYTRRATPATTGVTYSILTSTDLVSWPVDAGAGESVTATVDGVQTVEVTLTGTLLTNPKLFVRVQASK